MLRIAMMVASVLVTPALPASSYDAAVRKADACDTATAWAEQVAPGMWRGVCGDDQGHELIGNVEESAMLAWHIAESAGADADAAYEDAVARYNELDARGELPCYSEGSK